MNQSECVHLLLNTGGILENLRKNFLKVSNHPKFENVFKYTIIASIISRKNLHLPN